MENNLIVSPSPHIHGGDSISKNMYGVLIAQIGRASGRERVLIQV